MFKSCLVSIFHDNCINTPVCTVPCWYISDYRLWVYLASSTIMPRLWLGSSVGGWVLCVCVCVRVLCSPTDELGLTEQIVWLLKRCWGLWCSPPPTPSYPFLSPPSRAPQMPRYSKRSRAQKALPVDRTGGRRSDKHGPTLVSKLSCRSAPSATLSSSLDSLFLSLSLSRRTLRSGLGKKCWTERKEGQIEGRAQGGGKEAQCERIVLTVGEPEQNGECLSLWTVGGRAWQPASVSLIFVWKSVCVRIISYCLFALFSTSNQFFFFLEHIWIIAASQPFLHYNTLDGNSCYSL